MCRLSLPGRGRRDIDDPPRTSADVGQRVLVRLWFLEPERRCGTRAGGLYGDSSRLSFRRQSNRRCPERRQADSPRWHLGGRGHRIGESRQVEEAVNNNERLHGVWRIATWRPRCGQRSLTVSQGPPLRSRAMVGVERSGIVPAHESSRIWRCTVHPGLRSSWTPLLLNLAMRRAPPPV